MTPEDLIPEKATLQPLLVILLLGASIFLAGVFTGSCRAARKVDAQVQQADAHHETFVAHTAQAAVRDQVVEAVKPKLQADAGLVASLQAEVARLRQTPRPDPVPSAPPGDPQPALPPAAVTPLEAAKDQLIDALTTENTDLKTQNLNLTLARDSWRNAARESQQESLQLRAALAAKEGLIRAAELKGFLWGFATGNSTGGAAGFSLGRRR